MRAVRFVCASLGAFLVVGCHLILGLEQATLDCRAEGSVCTCQTNNDCGPPPECRVFRCIDGICYERNPPLGTFCDGGYCSDTEGAQIHPPSVCIHVECFIDSDCPDGEHCDDGYCGRCDNGILDGSENEIDCGGRCPTCLGFPCLTNEECLSGFCTDGRCCLAACDDVCAECDLTGDCVATEQYHYDAPGCVSPMICAGGGACLLRPGEPCVSDVECASFTCENNVCTGP